MRTTLASCLFLLIPNWFGEQNDLSRRMFLYLQGVDVSHHQKQIEWDTVAAKGALDFAFVKATEGHYWVDSLFCRNWEALRRVGLRRGAYHYFRPYGCGLDQAQHFLSTVEFHPGDLVPVLDIETTDGMPPELMLQEVRINGGGHWNHSMFWEIMAPNAGGEPSGDLASKIAKSFGNFDEMKKLFAQAGATRFGSGWAWLCVDGDDNLFITSTPNQDNPLMDVADKKGMPILGLDVWEHAYYLHYQNRRPDYIAAWWNVVNWEEAGRRYRSAVRTN